jgi:hypothetical protein
MYMAEAAFVEGRKTVSGSTLLNTQTPAPAVRLDHLVDRMVSKMHRQNRSYGLQMAGTLSGESARGFCWTNRGQGAPRSITDAQIERVVTKTLEPMPENSTHWTKAQRAPHWRSVDAG